MESINVGDAKSRFSELISRASSGERFIIFRRERPVAVILSPDEFERLERSAQTARRLALALGQDKTILSQIERGEAHPAMAGFGLWQDEPDLDTLVEDIYQARQSPRPYLGL